MSAAERKLDEEAARVVADALQYWGAIAHRGTTGSGESYINVTGLKVDAVTVDVYLVVEATTVTRTTCSCGMAWADEPGHDHDAGLEDDLRIIRKANDDTPEMGS